MTTWKDIQKLASDLQRIQLAQSVNKLSEQNCVEVISKLFNRKAINVVFTRDGHSYVTTKHLMTEVQNECLGNGGRCSLTEAATALNVDFDHVDAAAKRLVAEDDSYKLFNGELFSQEFAQRLHQELLVLLNEHGFQTVQQLAKHWNISQELLNSMLLDKVDSNLIVLDESTFYNKDYLESRKNVLRGILAAISKPMSIASIQKRVGLTTKRFWIAYDELQNEGEVSGRLSASRTSTACSYIPHYYDALIHQCLKNIYRQSNYIQVSLLRKLGIAEDKKEVEKMLEQKNIQQLPTLFIADSFYKEIVNGINEDLKNNGGLCDVRQYVQANELPIEDADIDEIGEKIAQEHKNIHSANGYLFNTDYLQKIVKLLEEKIELKAKLELDRIQSEKKQPQKSAKPEKDDDWNEGGGKKKKGGAKGKGSGAKQQQQPGRDRDEREESPIQTEEWLREVKEVPEDILDTVAEEIKPAVSERFQSVLTHLIATQSTVSVQGQKNSIQALQRSIKHLYDSICVFDAGCSTFSDPLATNLRQHLLRSVGADFAVAALSYAVGIDVPPQMKESQREELLSQLDSNLSSSLRTLFSVVKEGDAEKLHEVAQDLSISSTFQLKLKSPDKTTKAEVIASYESDLCKELASSTQAAALLTAVLILFVRNNQPVMASGKFVSQLIPLLKEHIEKDLYDLLIECQKSVVVSLKNKDDDVAKSLLDGQIDAIRAKILPPV